MSASGSQRGVVLPSSVGSVERVCTIMVCGRGVEGWGEGGS